MPSVGFSGNVTPAADTQKTCLTNALSTAGVTLPEKPTDGTRPQLTQALRDAMKAAAETCGLPVRGAPGQGQPGANV